MAVVRTQPIDVVTDPAESYPDYLARVAPTLTATLDDESGPTGWPTYIVEGERDDLIAYLTQHYSPGDDEADLANLLDD